MLCTDTVGQQRWFAVDRISIVGNDGVIEQHFERWRDITHQEELQRRLLLHEQLASLGRLAASIAHEVGNPLQSAVGCLELCQEDPALSPRVHEYLFLARGELERMARTLENLRNLYRPPQMLWQSVDLNEVLRQVQQFTIRQFARHNVHLRLDLDEALPLIYAQPDVLRQVFLNLILNAQEAMPEGGAIYAISRWLAADHVCQVYIRDTGIGMNAEQLRSLFEPFHSRKAQGAGLGLYLSKQLVEQHGGRVTVQSEQGKGTIFVVQLPWREGRHDNSLSDNPPR